MKRRWAVCLGVLFAIGWTTFARAAELPGRVVYLVDGTASMDGDVGGWRFIVTEVAKSFDGLDPRQTLAVVVGTPSGVKTVGKAAALATEDNKSSAWEGLATFKPAGEDDVPKWLAAVEALRPDLVWFVSDGQFKDSKAVVDAVRASASKGKFKVNTVASFAGADATPGRLETLRAIAKETGGTCVGDPEGKPERPRGASAFDAEKPAATEEPKPAPPSPSPSQPELPASDAPTDLQYNKSSEPERYHWRITNYLVGSASEIKATLDSEIMRFALKAGAAKREAEDAADRIEKRKQALTRSLADSKEYKAATVQMEAARLEMEAVKKAGGGTKQRMDASSKFNKAKAAVGKFEGNADADPEIKKAKEVQAEATERVARMRKLAFDALPWRKKLIDAIDVSVILRSPLKEGKSVGILGNVVVREVQANGSLVVDFELLRELKQTEQGEGIALAEYSGGTARVLITNPDVKNPRVGDRLALNNTYLVKKTGTVGGKETVIVERYPTDLDYLLDLIREPPDIDSMIGGKKTDESVQKPR